MGILKRTSAEQGAILLPAHCLIGRSPSCDVRFDDTRVSSQHASLRWTGEGWELCDLASRNGTLVDGRPLEKGERRLVRTGTVIRFGGVEPPCLLVDDGPPALTAVSEGGQRAYSVGDILPLPPGKDPEVLVYGHPQRGWLLERGQSVVPVQDGASVDVGGTRWRIDLPLPSQLTAEESRATLTLDCLWFTYRVSPDEEYVELSLRAHDRSVELGGRSHHYLALTLARQRLAHVAPSSAAAGWLRMEELERMLRMEASHINVSIYRVRQQLAKAGVLGAAGIIERSQQQGLRLGTCKVQVEKLDPSSN